MPKKQNKKEKITQIIFIKKITFTNILYMNYHNNITNSLATPTISSRTGLTNEQVHPSYKLLNISFCL